MNPAHDNYHEKVKIDQTLKLRETMDTLPRFCRSFFIGVDNSMSARTKLGYAFDLRIFFEFLKENAYNYTVTEDQILFNSESLYQQYQSHLENLKK